MNYKKSLGLARRYLESKKPDSFEIFYREGYHFLSNSRSGEIDVLEEGYEKGFAIRVIKDHRLGFSYVTSLGDNKIRDCIDLAIEGSKATDPDEDWSFAVPEPIPDFNWRYNDEGMKGISPSVKAKTAVRLEAEALGADERMKRVRKACYRESRIMTHLLNSLGVDLAFEKTLASCEIMAVAELDGDAQQGSEFDFSHTFDGLDVSTVGRRVAETVVSLLGARSIPTIKTPACLHPLVAAQLLEALSRAFFSDNIYKKKSALVERLNKIVYSGDINIVNDGLLEGGYSSMPFDGEGYPSVKTHLVRNGSVKGWLSDIYWGKKTGISSTGSSVRESLKTLPVIGIGNLYIEPGDLTKDDLLDKMGDGFHITGLIGAHTINPVTGEFSVGAEGQWLEESEVKHPVRGVVVAGNLHDLFRNVIGVASDLRFLGNVGSPSLLISEIQVSGR